MLVRFIKKCCLILLLTFLLQTASAATVDTVNIYSKAMKRSYKCVVIKPASYLNKKNYYPVVYLLHGATGDFSNWIKKVPAIKDHADKYNLLIVCPDGEEFSWYIDSPVDNSSRFETYIRYEVPAFIEANYRIIKNRNNRAITGLSMGGHGALYLAFRHSNFFGACGSMSGLMDLKAAGNNYELTNRLGNPVTHAKNWKEYSAVYFIERYSNAGLAIIIDCGIKDVFYAGNQQLHQKMLQLKIPHDYIERPGQHDWNYWSNAIEYHLLFFRKFFDRQ